MECCPMVLITARMGGLLEKDKDLTNLHLLYLDRVVFFGDFWYTEKAAFT